MARRSLADCLLELKASGELTPAEVKHLNDEFEKLREQFRLDLGDDAAALKAAQTVAAAARQEAALKRSAAANQAVALTRIRQDLIDYRDARGRENIFEAIEAHYVDNGGTGRIRSLDYAQKSVLGHLHSIFADGVAEFRRTIALGGVRHPAVLDNMVREVFGQGTGDAAAKGLADSWKKVTDYIAARYRGAGGVLGKIESYMPQWHDPRALRDAGFDQWHDFITARLDRTKMIDYTTNQPLDDVGLKNLLREIYGTITTEGWNEREPALREFGRGALWKRRAHERHLLFKDGDAWMDYERSFGSGHPLAAMWRHMSVMARDIATLETFGPSAQATHEWFKQVAMQEQKRAAAGWPAAIPFKGQSAERRGNKLINRIEDEWSIFRGQGDIPVDTTWSTAWTLLTNLQVSSSLGASFITSLGDTGTAEVARRFAGVHGSQLKDLVEHGFMRTVGGRSMSIKDAAEAGMVIDSAVRLVHNQARYVKGLDVRHLGEVISDRVLTWSFLTPWTTAGKHMAQFSLFREAAEHVGKQFADIPEHFRSTLERHGIDQTDWNIMRQAPLYDREGARWLRPTDISAIDDGPALQGLMKPLQLTGADEDTARRMAKQGLTRVGEKWAAAVMREAEFMVPTASIKAKAMLQGNSRPGTIPGTLTRGFALFRSYPIMLTMYWYDRLGAEWARNPTRAAGYGMALFTTLTGLGTLSEQLHQLAQGKDLRPWDDWKTYAAGIMRGGGLGIFGDFLFVDRTRYGATLGEQLAGPVFGTIGSGLRTFSKGAKNLAEDKETTFAQDFARDFYKSVPGSSIWYLKLAGQRYIQDNLARALDPDAEKKWNRLRNKLAKETGQSYWFEPGATAPSRLPSLAPLRGEAQWLRD